MLASPDFPFSVTGIESWKIPPRPASVAMILLARVGDVDGLGLLVFVGPQFLAGQELGAQQETGAPGGK
jgi:hypothetical protein